MRTATRLASASRTAVLGVLVALAAVLAVGGAPAGAQDAPASAGAVGIRLLEGPSERADDPRARQYIIDHLEPGALISRRIEISNTTAEPQRVELYAAAASIRDGGIQFADGRTANELTSWTTVGPVEVIVPSGDVAEATVTIAVPDDASSGERYGVVWAQVSSDAPQGGGVQAVNRVGIRLYLSAGEGGEPASDFTITELEARRDAEGLPLVAATVHNTGGRALDLSGTLQLRNGPGGLSAGPFDANVGTTLGIGETAPVVIPLDRAIGGGPWQAELVLRPGITEREATAQVTFPADPGATAGPVEATTSDGGTNWLVPVSIGVVAVLAAALGAAYLLKRRTHPVT